jgi:hypothetical protein
MLTTCPTVGCTSGAEQSSFSFCWKTEMQKVVPSNLE